MIKKFILLVFISSVVFGAEQDCEQYFEARKAQIELQTREFDEARQSLEAYKA
ncbi:nucleosidase, partial [Campylobacter coli]|nr:nucleosidase [Campylobacter coli]MCG4077353.1 nucleosidase [Campylobacter coli]